MNKEICIICENYMGNSIHKSKQGHSIHKKCEKEIQKFVDYCIELESKQSPDN